MQLWRCPEGGSGSLEYLSAGESAPERHTQYGVEGKAPHRAEAFVKMKCLVCKTCDME